ncbi:MAG: glycogen synthase GlgA [Oscillospiraceae bacterium]|jgi:starch synthase|nr:glycogen synthase GlgA [Oscillospiraceae bacterium]
MKVLYCTSEASPFASTGGLAEVAGSLPQALRLRLIGCRVVMPLYEDIPQELKDGMKFVTSLSVPVAWRRQYCGVFETHVGGVIVYLIDNQYYFKRHGLYGHFDDAERFAFFSRAVLEMLPYIEFKPDIIHANDWQTALVPVYYSAFYANKDWFSGIKTVMTIHNIQYQGKYGEELLEDVLGFPKSVLPMLQFGKCVNFMKGAIECANRVTTVSPTYAEEILDPWYSHGLDSILRERKWKLSGILNGIDTAVYNPETDPDLYANYTADDLSGKAENKLQLQKRLNLAASKEVPLMGMVTRMVAHKGLDLVRDSLDNLLNSTDCQFVILGSGDWEYETFFRELQERFPGRVCACFGFVPELSHKIYAASDLFLMPSKSEPCGLSQMIALRYGSVPVVRKTGGLKDSVTDSGDGEGNGFTFQNYDSDDMLHAVGRALRGYQNREGWEVLVRRGMECDYSWGHSANTYIRMYRSLLKDS